MILAALSKDPGDRPKTALEFADMLEAACPPAAAWSEDAAQTWWSSNLPEVMAGGHTSAEVSESVTAFLRPAG